jgi:hypothetical protein
MSRWPKNKPHIGRYDGKWAVCDDFRRTFNPPIGHDQWRYPVFKFDCLYDAMSAAKDPDGPVLRNPDYYTQRMLSVFFPKENK